MIIKKAIRRLIALYAGLIVCFTHAQTISGDIKGLTVAISFTDSPFTHPVDSISNMMNQPGFSGWGNMGSVRDFFFTQSNGMVTLTTTVVKINYPNTMNQFFTNPNQIADVINLVNQQNPQGFTNMTVDPRDGNLMYFNILCKAGRGAWAFGKQGDNISILNNGQPLKISEGHITTYDLFNSPTISVICHESGHNLMSWTDYYRTAFCNLGAFDVMASGGTIKAPSPINPGLRLQRGWIPNIINVPGDVNATYTLTANNYNTIHRYINPNNPKEYLLFHALKVGGYYQSPLDDGKTMPEGLAIWYVDEETGFDTPGQDTQFFIRLVQADNLDEMHDELSGASNVRGDMDDLYGNANKSFPNGHPLRWKDGGELGINIINISNPGNTMTFQVVARPSTVVASSDAFGTVSPKGTLANPNGGSRSFTLIPDVGYEVNTLKVNGTNVTPTNPYTMNGISGNNNSIQATFKRSAALPTLPNPWQRADIGLFPTAGLSGHSNGKFNLESYGTSNSGNSDNCHFLYQTLQGDGSLIARVTSFNRPTWNQKVGIMIRESLQSGAAQSSMMKVVFSGNYGAARSFTNGWLAENPNGIPNVHIYQNYNWMKITRTGNQVSTYCSIDGINWIMMSQQPVDLPSQAFIGLFVTGATTSYPAKAAFDNVRIEIPRACTISGSKISGRINGTEGSWGGFDNPKEKAFDGDISTYFDGPNDVSWAGLHLSNPHRITGIRFYPREGAAFRMVNGKFQGSNVADFSSGVVDLATIVTEPSFNWNCITINNTSGFRYVRYISPPNGFGNVAEIEFYGTPIVNIAPTVSILNPINNSNFNAPASITISATASDADGTIQQVQFFSGSTLLGSDATAPYSFNWSGVAAGTYTLTARATDNEGASTTSATVTVTVSVVPNATIIGPDCSTPFSTISFELNANQRTNVTSYSWWLNGSAASVTPVSVLCFSLQNHNTL
ncbi:MAG: Ig-like domain-containing protein [Cytophagaceae bacterium]|nr:Ig-like domain-containing protein [Cytophagaceae bacterium]